jgi:acyl-CoA reductase-like NAD-dependent aldehyde dehydrogenase
MFSPEPSVEEVLRAARLAQARWAETSLQERLEKVKVFRRLLPERGSDLAAAVELPERSLVAETLVAEILPLADACRFLERKAFSVLRPRARGWWKSRFLAGVGVRVERSPWGLVLAICAGNYPIFLPGVQVLQSLVAGNAVLLKPAPGTERVLSLLTKLLVEAGFDPELLVLLDESPESAQKVMACGVDKVLFTGSSQTGRAVLSQLAETVTPATLELSGCDAVFVHPDADLGLVADALCFGLAFNDSATCIAPRRVLVSQDRALELERRLGERLSEIPTMHLAPDRLRRMQHLVLQAVKQGARLVGRRIDLKSGSTPMVLAEVRPEMEVARADIFAPVLSIMIADSLEEALALDSQCPYALGASVFGPQDAATAWAEKIHAGVVVINDLIAPTADPRIPFGGRGESGFGTTRGSEGLIELTRPRVVVRRGGRWRPHFQQLAAGDEVLFETLIEAKHARSWIRRLRSWIDLGRVASRKSRMASRGTGDKQ